MKIDSERFNDLKQFQSLETNFTVFLLLRFRENDWEKDIFDTFDTPLSPFLNSSSFPSSSDSSFHSESVCNQISPETRFSLPLRLVKNYNVLFLVTV